MRKNKTFTVKFKRKRQGKTNYKKRIKYLKSEKTRIVVRISNNNMTVQSIDFKGDGDKVISTITSLDLRKLGWKYNIGNMPSSYLTGLYFGIKNKDKIKEAIIDIGLKSITKGDRISAVIKGIVDSGLNVPYSEVIFPNEKRISGEDIAAYAKSLSQNKEKYEKQFSRYLKLNLKPENISIEFKKIKEKILSEK